MNILDIIIIVIVGYCLIRGIFRGLIKELSSIIGVLAAFYTAYSYYPKIAHLLRRWVTNSGYLNILSFFILFCLVFVIISMLGVIIKYLLNIAFLGWVDRICGAGFGVIKGILIVSVIVLTLTAFLQRGSPLLADSLLSPHVLFVSEKMAKVVPGDMKGHFNDGIRALEREWENP
jgi:membrane protein required for colicin V production